MSKRMFKLKSVLREHNVTDIKIHDRVPYEEFTNKVVQKNLFHDFCILQSSEKYKRDGKVSRAKNIFGRRYCAQDGTELWASSHPRPKE